MRIRGPSRTAVRGGFFRFRKRWRNHWKGNKTEWIRIECLLWRRYNSSGRKRRLISASRDTRFERGLDEALNGASLAAYDLSEAEGLDDLHHAEGVIAEAQRLAAETWKAKKTFFLVNGTTCGNEAWCFPL